QCGEDLSGDKEPSCAISSIFSRFNRTKIPEHLVHLKIEERITNGETKEEYDESKPLDSPHPDGTFRK
ncbi:hypothetical protein AVEN_12170-1, partial [Araneus ventricosus]